MSDATQLIEAFAEVARTLDSVDLVAAAQLMAQANALCAAAKKLEPAELARIRELHRRCTVSAEAAQRKLFENLEHAGRGRRAARAYRR